ncbi:hypothetical protein A3H09_01430 [Candidatus Falkowbacteria bacterium RIFCSPLOWO2_12_FULL_45_13]|uniref:HEPN domain-containing protein n=2 Tax=Candidatus Falkowiibacteriota TaxID=1752728 RepID=A0A1F5SB45_9BACT|nr:MAG: hypothetical protein A3H66_01405 [Candidatus Falkowbacteria bacterium RIFCSPLOWO2_02_FULL_45_21]OGF32150.1 MAG: hypothetical protein A3H09_01430 [Candidatus Falkowbacteria bacterium RIFCSPLOWO2_12_FULL_45_13]
MKTTKQQEINFLQIRSFLESVERRLKKAEQILKVDEQSGFQAAYEAMIRASLGFMLSFGRRPRSTVGHHKIIIEFVGQKFGNKYVSLIGSFDEMRKKRNKAIYEPFGTIGEKEAADAIKTAKEFIGIVYNHIRDKDRQPTLKI